MHKAKHFIDKHIYTLKVKSLKNFPKTNIQIRTWKYRPKEKEDISNIYI